MNNNFRRFPTREWFIGDKKMNDIIYGFFQTNSKVTEDGIRYCYKKDASAGKIVKYFTEQQDRSFYSERTIRNIIKLFTTGNEKTGEGIILKQGELNGKKVYFLPDLNDGEFVLIKMKTLKYLVNTASTNVIKVYAFLKLKQFQHDYYHYETPYMFSQKKLLNILGYGIGAENKSENMGMIKDILNCLQNNQLIKVHKEWVPTGNDNATSYFVLDEVNEDYKDNFSFSQTDSREKESLKIPVSEENPVSFGFSF